MTPPQDTPDPVLRMREHPHAPRWNHSASDRLRPEDREEVERFRAALRDGRGPRARGEIPAVVQARLARLGWDDLGACTTTSREDLVLRPERMIPEGADLSELIVYRTAGTTGHATLVPHHPRAASCYLPLIEVALERYGVDWQPAPGDVACLNVGAQARTVTYPCRLTAWNDAGFAKLNLRSSEWPSPDSARAWIPDMAPALLTGDAMSFVELLRLEVAVRPRAMLATAVAMSLPVRRRLEAQFGCPVIDWYSLTETGPIGYRCTSSEAYHLLPHDLHVELLDAEGRAVEPGERGEITVSGGRNPFLPLVRYRTGDWGRVAYDSCPCGDSMPRILDLEGRAPVLFRAADGALVNPVDLARLLREHPMVQHELEQRPDRSLRLRYRPLPGRSVVEGQVADELATLMGPLPLELVVDEQLGTRDGKVVPWKGLALLEE